MRKLFIVKGDYPIFTDSQNEDRFYCMTNKTVEEKNKVLEKYDCYEEDIPPSYTIKAYRVEKAGTNEENIDLYDRIPEAIVDFPIYRIKWIFLKLV